MNERVSSEEEAYRTLCAYTLTRGDPDFIHQHVVDAWAAQHASEKSKPIGVAFALVGLYLHVEHQFTGRQVQRAHMTLARDRRPWPVFMLSEDRGTMTVIDVMVAPEGAERDGAIHAWCASVWGALSESRNRVQVMLKQHSIL
jgi:hypothetical protein